MLRHRLTRQLLSAGCAVLLVVPTGGGVMAQDYVDKVRSGNEAYRQNDYNGALQAYHDAETAIPESPQLQYNMAGVHYQRGEYEQAVDLYQKALNAPDAALQAMTHYNLGNTYSEMQDYQSAIKQFEQALELNPDDMDAKYNLELARKLLKEQMKPEQQENQKQQDQEQKKKEEEEKQDEQQQQQQQQQDQKENDEQQQQPGGDEEKKEEQQQQPSPSEQQMEEQKMSKEDAERILNALKDDEREIQKQIRRDARGSGYTGKDW